jgi:hypothetical protein
MSNRDISDSIGTWLRTGWSGVRIPGRQEIFLLPKTSRPVLGLTLPPIQWVPGFFPWDKAEVE